MELSQYAQVAVRLVNTERPALDEDSLTSLDAVRQLAGFQSHIVRRVTESDLTRLRAVRSRLRAVFTAASEGDEVRAVDLLNALLVEFPASPQISGHETTGPGGRPRWHMHLAEHPASAAAGYAATACMGLAFLLTGVGADRLGICQAPPCRNAYVDTSTNRSRRYCSDRCATRANVAAYRARKRRESEERERPDNRTSGRTAPAERRSVEETDR
ncbi:CGNR zinc finger domain-containing protein [Streptomyces sulphureus]|uniref:CGNR zinc finger domain-containing protein n=1 Tax=Streptomyces sulphureus TaxID=47758 RepID=UPI00037F2AF7|nr:CGNR zinc finger domain-containing protein [Streptomyces sulphureus]